MGKNFFDYEDGNFARSISDNMAIDSDGDLEPLIFKGGQ